jgi:hypothetical protein
MASPEEPDKMTDDHNAHSAEAGVFQEAMKAALAELDRVRGELESERNVLADLQEEARDEVARIHRESETLARKIYDDTMQQRIKVLRHELHVDMLKKLILWGIPTFWIQDALEIDASVLTDVWMDLGFEKLGDHAAHVGFDLPGRDGHVIFYREDLVLRWACTWSFGSADEVIAVIRIPPADKWEAEARMPLRDRDEVLAFVARRVVRDRAPGCTFQVNENEILIVR